MPEKSLQQQIDEAIGVIKDMSSNLKNGTMDFGQSKEIKVARVYAIALAKSEYYN